MSNIKYVAALATIAVGVRAILSFTETPGQVADTTVPIGLLVVLMVAAVVVLLLGAAWLYIELFMGARGSRAQNGSSRQQEGDGDGDNG